MHNRRVTELFRKERYLRRLIRRKMERYDELVAKAVSTGSFRYDQDRVTGSAPEGSRHEELVAEYVELGKNISVLQNELGEINKRIRQLIAELPPRERRIMYARHVQGEKVEQIMQRFGIRYETYRVYHSNAMKRMDKNFQGDLLANINKT